MMTADAKPLTEIERDPDAKLWWDGVARGELLYQRCPDCGEVIFFPRSHCPNCLSDRLSWEKSAGKGTVYALTTIHRAPDRRLADEVPYVVLLVDLDEGFRMLSRLVAPAGTKVAVGDRLRVTFGTGPDGAPLPFFEPDGAQ